MEVKKVLIIHSCDKTKQSITQDLLEEGFNYAYKFASDIFGMIEPYVDEADEVWTYGSVNGDKAYQYAVESGSDIWCMA